MNCEEKLEEAKRLYESANDDQKYVLEDLFPELRESEDEDEKIRIAILNYLRKMWANCKDNVCGVHIEDAIAWLEKQGEQKLINKIEPKFKVGDWIIGGIYNKPKQILEIRNEGYVTDRGWVGFSFVEDMHLWTLQDAEDGDVLVSKYNQPFIYNGNYNSFHVGSYCGVSNDRFIDSGSKCFWTENVNIRPATKEKCDLLFKRMEEAGYKWDAEKKRLVYKVEPKFHVGEWLCENEPNNYARFIQILEIVNVQGKERYRISRDIRNDEDIVEFNFIEKYFHKFDIKDAKYGDVLVHNDCAFIFVGLEGNIVRALAKTLFDGIIPIYLGEIDENNDYHPATKEQRDFLFKSMKDDGYEWDTEKKELKKIHVIDEGKDEMDYCFTKMMNGERVSPAWSEEDEEIIECLNNCLDELEKENGWRFVYVNNKNVELNKIRNWLNSLKPQNNITDEELAQAKKDAYNDALDKIEYHSGEPTFDDGWSAAIDYIRKKSLGDRVQPKQVWSEEDERNWNNIWDVLDGRFELSDYGYKEAAKWFLENCSKGLKSLRQQPKQEWSEEDEKMFSELSSSLLINISDQWVKYGKWLKSLKGRITWKPTEAQLASLTIACDRNDRVGFDLTQLLEELKKL